MKLSNWIGILLLVTGGCSEPALSTSFMQQVNEQRIATGLPPLAEHPALSKAAQKQADRVARSGSPTTSQRELQQTMKELLRSGYGAHTWTSSTVIGPRPENLLSAWRKVKPDWLETLHSGDFEHYGLGRSSYRGQPVHSLFVGRTRHTVEWRQAEPLSDLVAVRHAVLEAVNRARIARRRQPLTANLELDLAAQRHAEDQLRRGYYAHQSPEGDTVRDRAIAAGYRGARSYAENIAKGLFDPEEVVRRWLDSSGHRRNILSPKLTALGVGVAFGDTDEGLQVLWVQAFAGPR